jgi:hypothetical protein
MVVFLGRFKGFEKKLTDIGSVFVRIWNSFRTVFWILVIDYVPINFDIKLTLHAALYKRKSGLFWRYGFYCESCANTGNCTMNSLVDIRALSSKSIQVNNFVNKPWKLDIALVGLWERNLFW